jgi:hypothetical protein
MAKEPVFYSFHYDNDVFRVQQIRNMGVVAGDEPVSANEWERLKRTGDSAVERWIDSNMSYKRCVIVLVGSATSTRPWVQYEIKRAYNTGKGLFGIYIHNLKCPRTGQCGRGTNPFDAFTINNGRQSLSSVIPCYDPGYDAYAGIYGNLTGWVSSAIDAARNRS